MQARAVIYKPNLGKAKPFPMPVSGKEPNDVELRQRIRNWLRHYKVKFGWNQSELATAMGLTEATISLLVRDLEDPGLTTLARMHFRLGADLQQVLRSEPSVVASQVINRGPNNGR